jgi:hypothetical protein
MADLGHSRGSLEGCAAEDGSEVPREWLGVVLQLIPRDPDDAPAFRLQRAVAGAIGLEGRPHPVHGLTVELDDQPLGPPDAVALDPGPVDLEPGVCLGLRQTRSLDEIQESRLELAAGELDSVFQQGPEDRSARAPRVPLQKVWQ